MDSRKQKEISRAIGRGDYVSATAHIESLTSTDNPVSFFDYICHPKHVLGFSQVSHSHARLIAAQPERLTSCIDNLHFDETVMTVYVPSNVTPQVKFLKRENSFFGEINRHTGAVTLYLEKDKIGSGGRSDVYLYADDNGAQRVVKKSRENYDMVLAFEHMEISYMNTLYLSTSNNGDLVCFIYHHDGESLTHVISAALLKKNRFFLDYPLSYERLTSQIQRNSSDFLQLLSLTGNFNLYWRYQRGLPIKLEDIKKKYGKEYQISKIAYKHLGPVGLFTFLRAKENQYATRLILPFAPGDSKKSLQMMRDEHVLAQVCLQLLNALRALHAEDVFHGDLNLDNIRLFIQEEPSMKGQNEYKKNQFRLPNGRVFKIELTIIDYDLAYQKSDKARVCTAELARECQSEHWAPERTTNNKDLDAQSSQDVFALGDTLKKMLNISPAGPRLRTAYPSIAGFMTRALQIEPNLRPTLESFHISLTKEIVSKAVSSEKPRVEPEVGVLSREKKKADRPSNKMSTSKTDSESMQVGMRSWCTWFQAKPLIFSSDTSSDLMHQRHSHSFRPALL